MNEENEPQTSEETAQSPPESGGPESTGAPQSSAEPSSESSPASSSESSETEGPLAGTTAEQEPGVGGTGDHPAPAVMRDPETGALHSAGEAPAGTAESGQPPASDTADLQAGDVTDEEARERLNAVIEPEPHPIERPDLGTE